MSKKRKKVYGLAAEYDSAKGVYHACEKVRDAGYTIWDAHTPFPVHGLDKAMGLKPSILPWIIFAMGMTGMTIGITLQYWTSAVDYPTIIAGKPLFSWQAFVPVTFELTILLSAFGAVFGMLGLNKLPQLYHPLFNLPAFSKVTDDRFFIAIEVDDPNYDENRTRKLLESTGAMNVYEVED